MKIKIRLLSILIILTLSSKYYAQGEANIWYFGNNAGINFNGGAPVALTNGGMATSEGCAAISTAGGVLRFYTDGVTVWNNLHSPMPNGTGLAGNTSSTQSGIIVSKPGSQNIYYIFTVDAVGGLAGLRYSEADMTLNGGLGDITAAKNIFLATPVTEKLTAVKKANNVDFWVIAHDASNTFLVYSVTSAGVNTAPVTSNAGTLDNVIGNLGVGYLKASSDGSKLAQAISNNSVVDILNFNSATGIITNNFTFTPSIGSAYGVEFSPDGKRFYVTFWASLSIMQYDMTLGSATAIIASESIIGTSTASLGFSLGALQTGPDGKIYVARNNEEYLGCINNPNSLGLNCNFVDNAVNLSDRISEFGLPNFVQTFFNTSSNNSVTVLADEIIIPNVFTPDGDGVNDLFDINVAGFKDAKCSIYDRWGLLLNESQGTKLSWDGITTAGLKVSDGTYYYIIFATNQKGEVKKYSGFVSLIRK